MTPLCATSTWSFGILLAVRWSLADSTATVPFATDSAVAAVAADPADPLSFVAPPTPAPTVVAWPAQVDLPPESVTMKSWDALKGSMDDIGQEVQQVLLVKSDISSLQGDLKTQQQMWRKAEQDLVGENAELQKEVLALQLQVQSGALIEDELANLTKQIDEAKRQQSDLLHAFDDAANKHKLDMGFLQNRTQQLELQNDQANKSAMAEIAKVHETQMHVQADYQALHLKATELQDRLRDGQKGLPLQQQQGDAKTRDLGRQLAEMQRGLQHMVKQILPEGKVQEEIKSLKKQLDVETEKIVKLTQEQAQDANNCEVQRKEHEAALDTESAKFQERQQEVTQLCDAVQAQRRALTQGMTQCEAGEVPENYKPAQELPPAQEELRAIE